MPVEMETYEHEASAELAPCRPGPAGYAQALAEIRDEVRAQRAEARSRPQRASRSSPALALIIALANLVAVAVKLDGTSSNTVTVAAPAAAAAPAPAPAPAAHASAVTLSEFNVAPKPAAVASGAVTFNVSNAGKVEHEFVVLKTSKPASDLLKDGRADEAGNVGEIGSVKPGQTKALKLEAGRRPLRPDLQPPGPLRRRPVRGPDGQVAGRPPAGRACAARHARPGCRPRGYGTASQPQEGPCPRSVAWRCPPGSSWPWRRRRHPVVRRAHRARPARPTTIPTGRRPRCARCCARSTPAHPERHPQLASFGTRHTLSSQTDPNRGIGAARDWIFDQLQGYAAASGGRMTVQKQSFVQPPGPRNPEPVTVTNLVATLRGTQPESADRVYVVSGHYDSRCTDVLNFTCDAPGADDDASGVAAVLELARVMAKRQFDATIVFMAVAGEEQGLYGSTFFAQQAKAAGMDVEGMFTNDIVGSSTSDKGRRDPFTVRLFSEGVPDHRDAAAGRPAPVDRRRERRALAPARALRQGGRRELGHRACTCG